MSHWTRQSQDKYTDIIKHTGYTNCYMLTGYTNCYLLMINKDHRVDCLRESLLVNLHRA